MYVFVKNYLSYVEKDRKKIFKLFRDYFEEKKKFIYFKDVLLPHKREVFRCMMDDDFDRFDLIATCVSYKIMKDDGIEIDL